MDSERYRTNCAMYLLRPHSHNLGQRSASHSSTRRSPAGRDHAVPFVSGSKLRRDLSLLRHTSSWFRDNWNRLTFMSSVTVATGEGVILRFAVPIIAGFFKIICQLGTIDLSRSWRGLLTSHSKIFIMRSQHHPFPQRERLPNIGKTLEGHYEMRLMIVSFVRTNKLKNTSIQI